MTPAERQLLAAVHRHARTTGWTHGLLGWVNPTRTAAIAAGQLSILTRPAECLAWLTWPSTYDVTSVRQAVALLVALGHLPARFSNAYREGRDYCGGLAIPDDDSYVPWIYDSQPSPEAAS